MIDYSRNWLFIDDALQAKLANCHIFVMGVGIGSVFAELALRSGVRKFTLADGDVVDASNLNRQNYTSRDIGVSKAQTCADRLLLIDPEVSVKVIDRYLDHDDLNHEIPKADIVINTIDFDSPVFLLASRLCRQFKKLEIFPMNLGFGSSVCVFKEDSPSWETMLDFSNHVELKLSILEYIARSASIAPYLQEAKQKYFQQTAASFDPQLAVSTMVSASMMMGLILKTLQGESLQYFPHFYFADATLPYVMTAA
ncbi:MAG: ThiF family adenylyltransferase [Oligoflexus sp.]